MSGRPKRTEAEDLRQLTREAHAAIKDLRLVQREIRDARAEHTRALQETLQQAASAAIDRVDSWARLNLEQLQGQADKLAEHIATLSGVEDWQTMGEKIIAEVAAAVVGQLMPGIEAGAELHVSREPGTGQIYVTTDPAKAPPGSIVIDRR